jgi:hypothetical protein
MDRGQGGDGTASGFQAAQQILDVDQRGQVAPIECKRTAAEVNRRREVAGRA